MTSTFRTTRTIRTLGTARTARTARALATVAGLAAAFGTALSTPAGAAGEGSAVHLRVATYNIHAGAGEDGVFDLDRTAAAIRGLNADVVGLEEVDVNWSDRSAWMDEAAELGRLTGMRVFFAPIYSLDPLSAGAPRREYGVAVLSRFPIASGENHEITRLSTQVPNPVPTPAPGFAEAVVKVKGVRVHVYVTHLDYRSDPAVRRAQVADTRQVMAQDGPAARQLLLGDFNAGPAAPELAPLWGGLTDAWSAVHGSGGGLSYPAGTPVSRIDYVTASPGVQVGGAEVVDTKASDHRPVVADVVIDRKG
ncbi:endonuclease/exonuclease/phosphatase family protein [Actinomadura alba]|uniref:Endonuclease/exonuclease/phosphatase family protein n=1 Tax=Actinomadura alba TaxID=406431 RepID=A0ABR7M120_9ACTN|nr:endonuclease/exonuclease/phosphatase family protein [Actinomadura alba]MBC6470809.1 endonuclease/exonuclease/phosphatase family protein [Actinomadura alba]